MFKQTKGSFMLLVCSLLIAGTSSCKKEDSATNWAKAVEGTYNGTGKDDLSKSNAMKTIVTRISDNRVNFQISYGSDSYCLDSVTLTSSSTFTINEFDGCGAEDRTGGGSFSNGNLNYSLCCYAGSYQMTMEGTK